MLRTAVLTFAFVFASQAFCAGPNITIVVGDHAPALEKRAAEQLGADLRALFDATVSESSSSVDAATTVLLGSPATNSAIPADAWPKLSEQGHVLRSTSKGLVVGGNSPTATLWAVSELACHFGIRHLLYGDAMPIEKPALKLEGIDELFEPAVKVRAWTAVNPWSTTNTSLQSTVAWPLAEQQVLVAQLAKLKFTHLVLPGTQPAFPTISVEGDIGGRMAFKGAKAFPPAPETDLLKKVEAAAVESGLAVTHEMPAGVTAISPGAPLSVLPQFGLERLAKDFQQMLSKKGPGYVAVAVMPEDLNAAAYFISRASFDPSITAEKSLESLITPICGDEVASRLWKGFQQVEQASALIAANDPDFGIPVSNILLRHLEQKEAPPAWLTDVKTLYLGAMNEMYRGNTRARGGARSLTLYHAKRFEFAMQFCTAVEALKRAGNAAATKNSDARAEASEQGLEAIYNALNAYADVAHDAGDRSVIALLNEHGYRPLMKALSE